MITLIFAWNVPLVSLIFLKRSLVFPILLFFSVSLHWSLKKAFLSLLAILWNSAFSRSVVSNSLWPVDCSLPGFSGYGVFQARTLESGAISYSRGSSRPKDQNHISYIFCIGRQIENSSLLKQRHQVFSAFGSNWNISTSWVSSLETRNTPSVL